MLKIAIIGSRGIPSKYGGFETFTEELSTRLVNMGHEVFVSCEGGISPKIYQYKGVKLYYFPLKPFFRIFYETIYDIYSLMKSSLMCDCIYILGYGAGFFFFIPKFFGKKLIVNVDGMEWTRDKYNILEKAILYCSEVSAILFSDVIIADAIEIKKHIKLTHNKKAVFIPYGADIPRIEPWNHFKLKEATVKNKEFLNLERHSYYLVIARLEPENNVHVIVEGFLLANTNKKLVITGNFLSHKYKIKVNNILRKYNAYKKVIFTGAIYKKDLLNMLRQNCFAYFHGHSAGGTNPSLLEIMAMRNIVIAQDNKFNREVGEESILYFKDSIDLKNKIEHIEKHIDAYCGLRDKACERIENNYSWKIIVEEYDSLFKHVLTREKTIINNVY
jgi:glycosyltransferase involved in cell wall biosynthesis